MATRKRSQTKRASRPKRKPRTAKRTTATSPRRKGVARPAPTVVAVVPSGAPAASSSKGMVVLPAGVAHAPNRRELRELAERAKTQRVVLIEGDSWMHFPVPGAVALDWAVRDHHDYNIELHFARAGATLLGMVYGDRRRDLSDVLEALELVGPRVMLFSGGGNDVVGPEFAQYLNHRGTGRPILNAEFADMKFKNDFLPAYRKLITAVHETSPHTKIFVHGYAHAFPDGRAVDIAFFDELGIIRIGPWMRPSLMDRGWDERQGRQVVVELIDRFNDMLDTLQAEFPGTFHHVDFRPLVSEPRQWRDELHLNNAAWRKCAAHMHATIAANVRNW